MRETTALIYSPKMTTKFSFKLDNINISVSMSAGGSLKKLCHFGMGGSGKR